MRAVHFVLTLFAILGIATAHPVLAGDARAIVEWRNGEMRKAGDALSLINRMAKGTKPFDKAQAISAIEVIRTSLADIPAFFPPGSITPASRAKPAIWQDFPGFSESAADFLATLPSLRLAIEHTDRTEFSVIVRRVGDGCMTCHDLYRGPPRS